MRSNKAPWLAVLAILAFFTLMHLPSPESPAQPSATPTGWQSPPDLATSDLPVPGQWTSGIELNAQAEAQAAWGPRYGTLNSDQVAMWNSYFGRQLTMTQQPQPVGANDSLWRPRGWLTMTSASAQTSNATVPANPAPPGQGQNSTLADSMYARWVIQYRLSQQLEQLIGQGISVNVQADPAQTALLTQIENHLSTLAQRPAGVSNAQLTAALNTQTQAIVAAVTQAGESSGLTPQQLQALTNAIRGIGTAVDQLGDEIESSLGGSVTPPADD